MGTKMKKLELKKIIKEEITNFLTEESQNDHSLMRFYNITMKASSSSEATRLINSRTDKITNKAKLQSWIDVLEDENYHTEAEYAYNKLKTLKR